MHMCEMLAQITGVSNVGEKKGREKSIHNIHHTESSCRSAPISEYMNIYI